MVCHLFFLLSSSTSGFCILVWSSCAKESLNAETFLRVLHLRDYFSIGGFWLHLSWRLNGMHGKEGNSVQVI